MKKGFIVILLFICLLVSCDQASPAGNENNLKEIKNGYSVYRIKPEFGVFDISLDSKNRICYSDKDKIVAIDNNGNYTNLIDNSLEFCTVFASGGENIYAWDSEVNTLKKFKADGKLIKEYLFNKGEVKKLSVEDNTAVVLYQDKNDKNNQSNQNNRFLDNSYLDIINLADNTVYTIEHDKVISFTDYKDKKIMICTLTHYSTTEFYVFDTIKKTMDKIYEEPFFINDICYSIKDDAIYYCMDGRLYRLLRENVNKQLVFTSESKSEFMRLYLTENSCYLLNSDEGSVYEVNVGSPNKETNNTIKILSYLPTLDTGTKIGKATEVFRKSGMNITFEAIDPREYYQILKTRLMANDSSFDIFHVGDTEIDYLVKNRAVMDLSSYKEITSSFNGMFDGILQNCTYKGILAGVPYSVSVYSWGVNDELLKELKIGELPESPWTWYDFYELAKKARKDLDGDGSFDTYIFQSYDYILDWVRQYNCAYYNLLEEDAEYDTDEFRNLLELAKKLKEENLISTGKTTFKKTDNILFYQNSLSLNSGNGHYIHPPTLTGKRIYTESMSFLCINPNTKKADNAVKFLSAYISKEVQTCDPFFALYKDISVYNKKSPIGKDWDLANEANYNLYESITKYSKKQFAHPDFNVFQNTVIRNFLEDKINLEDAVNTIQQKADIIIGE